MGGLTRLRKTLKDRKQNRIGFYLSDFGIIS